MERAMTSSTIERIHFVEYNAKLNTLAMRQVAPKYGTPLLATILRDQGYAVQMFLDGVSDMSFEKLSACDLVCLPLFVPAYNKVKAFTRELRARKPDIPIIIGGPHAILYPDTVVGLCDYVVRCEGDEVLPELVGALRDGADVEQVKGISFLRDGEMVSTPDREPPVIPTTIPDLSVIEGLDRVLARGGRYKAVQNILQTSRGCTYKCRFCPTPKLFSKSYRNREIDSIVAEIRYKQRYNDFFFVVDNNFFGDRARSVALLERLAEEDLGASLIIFARQEIGHDQELLWLLRRAGVKCVIVGVESLVDDNLLAFDKQQRAQQVMDSIDNIKSAGIHVIATFAFGYEGDTEAKAKQIVEFIRNRGLTLNVFILHDTEVDERKRLLIPLEQRFSTHYQRRAPTNTDAYDYATGNFVTYFPKHMKPSTLQRCYLSIYRDVYTDRYILKNLFSKSAFESIFGVFHGYSIRRLNEAIQSVVDDHYMDHLLSVEKGLYDDQERLIVERLADLDGLPPPPPLPDQVDRSTDRRAIELAMLPGAMRFALHKARRRISRRIAAIA